MSTNRGGGVDGVSSITRMLALVSYSIRLWICGTRFSKVDCEMYASKNVIEESLIVFVHQGVDSSIQQDGGHGSRNPLRSV